MLLHDLILDRATNCGSNRALIRGDHSASYAELAENVRNAATGLGSIGLAPNERVGIYLNKRVEAVTSYFATTLAGGVFVPINSVLKPAQVEHILNDCDVSILITTASQADALAESLANCRSIRHIVTIDTSSETNSLPEFINSLTWQDLNGLSSARHEFGRRIDSDMASILYTSGSTGKPKGVVLSHRNMVAGASSVSTYIGNTADDVILSVLPLSFDAGFSQLTTGFIAGAAVVLLDYLLPREVTKVAARHAATGLTGVPPLWNQLAKFEWPEEAIDSMRYIANTGGAMPSATLDQLRRRLPNTKVFLMYGLTEAFRSTYLPPEELDNRPTSIGKAIPNAEILVVREDGSLCEPNEPGELVHRGALVSMGYWNDQERTDLRFRPAPNQVEGVPGSEIAVWSGDTVVKDEDGFLYFVGRADDMIKSSGYRISPTEIEEVAFATGLVSECAALGIPDPEIGQAIVIAADAPSPGEATSDAIIQACKQRLPNYMIPAKIVWRESLPRNPNGKIDRKRLATELQSEAKEPEE